MYLNRHRGGSFLIVLRISLLHHISEMSAPSSPRSPTKKSIGSAAASSQPSVPTAPAHNVFPFDNNIIFSSNFDNGNLGRVERVPNRPYEFKVWTAPDNMGTEFQSKHCAWFHFSVVGLPMGCVLRIQLVNASNHSGLYKHDMVFFLVIYYFYISMLSHDLTSNFVYFSLH